MHIRLHDRSLYHRPLVRAGIAAFIVGLFLLAPVTLGSPASLPPPLSGPILPTTLTVSNSTLSVLGSSFWGADLRPYYTLGSPESVAFNSTPLQFLRWPGGTVADQYNYTANRIYGDGNTWYTPPTNESQFIAWCRSVACGAIMQLPGEIDSPSTAAYYVAYTIRTLHFTPSFWEIGNEPAQWTHFKVAWANWTAAQNTNATPGTYAQVVQSYISAIRAVAPKAKFVGLPGVGTGSYDENIWIKATVRLNGPNISAVGIHVYPAGGSSTSGNATVGGFASTLQGKGSLLYRIPVDEAAIRAGCSTCRGIRIFVTELGSGTQGGPYSGYMGHFADVPYIAAEVAQAMQQNVPNVDLFAFESSYNGSILNATGSPTDIYTLYSEMLIHLRPIILNSTLSGAPTNFYVVAARNGSGSEYSLLMVNANISESAQLSLLGSGLPIIGSGASWSWNGSSRGPITTTWSLLPPLLWTVPPRSVLVVDLKP
jgi:hypothetical protein